MYKKQKLCYIDIGLKNYYVRFDVAEVYLNHFDNTYKINIIEDAFR